MMKGAIISAILGWMAATSAPATDYYVSPSGDDSNPGTTPQTAWRTAERVNRLDLEPGDAVRFEGGKTFAGPLLFGPEDRGQSTARITVSSYGQGRAWIDGGAGDGIRLERVQFFDLKNLNVKGLGRKTGNLGGRGIFPILSGGLTIEGVEATGFQRAGLEFQGCTNLRITGVYAHDNGYAGISSGPENAPVSRNAYIGYCRAINNPGDPTVTDNHSGSGIVLYRILHGVVEFCEAANNGWDMQQVNENGPVGIWTAMSKDVIIQRNISHNNRSPKGDGGGFDFDGRSESCLLQYNYSYDNDGCGYLLCTWDPNRGCRGNVVRYNISQRDGRKNHGAGIFVYQGKAQEGIEVYHNVVFNDDGRDCVAGEISRGFAFHNNIFVMRGGGRFVNGAGQGRFEGNLYWNYDGPGNWDGYRSFDKWVGATGKETRQGKIVGLFADPKLLKAGQGERLTDPAKLIELAAYRLGADSPCIDRGMDINELYGIHPGFEDFFGKPIRRGKGYDIGACEIQTVGQ
jgi:hypothetical protein